MSGQSLLCTMSAGVLREVSALGHSDCLPSLWQHTRIASLRPRGRISMREDVHERNADNSYSLLKSGLRHHDIFTELPVVVHNSHILTSFLHQLPSQPAKKELVFPSSLASLDQDPSLTTMPLAPNYDSLDLSIDPFLEKTCDLLLDSIENHHSELNNYQFYQRSLAREQAKITGWQQKRKAENAQRVITKQTPLPEDEWQRLFKLPQEPSRLETLLNSRQIEQYAKQVDGFTATVSSKMFAVKSTLLPDLE